MKKCLAILLACTIFVSACGSDNVTNSASAENTVIENNASTSESDTFVVISEEPSGENAEENNTSTETANTEPETETYTYDEIMDYENTCYDEVVSEINPYIVDSAVGISMTEEDRDLYKKAVDAILARESQVYLKDDYDKVLYIMYLLQNCPYAFVCEEYDVNRAHNSIWFKYKFTEEEQKEKVELMNSEYLKIFRQTISPEMGDLERVLAIYRYFGNRIDYDYDWLNELNQSEDQFLFPGIEIYQALETGKGVCHTYSYLCEFALLQLGMECMKVSGEMLNSDDSHMWLIVNLNGYYYHIDPTWDDGEEVSLRYFGMTDDESYDRGIWCVDTSINEAFKDVICFNTEFAAFRNITSYTLPGDGTIWAHYNYFEEPVVIDLSTFFTGAEG